jgi:hypothetical protein
VTSLTLSPWFCSAGSRLPLPLGSVFCPDWRNAMWDYEWLGYGLTITAPCGKDIFMQGEEASELHDRLEAMSPEEVQAELSEYDVLLDD